MHKTLKLTAGMLATFCLTLFLSACGKAATPAVSIGVLSGLPVQDPAAVSAGLPIASPLAAVAGIALEQQNGYTLGFKAAKANFATTSLNENAGQSELQRSIRNLVEDPRSPLLAIVGATSNSETSHAAALVNFFNVPMLVPSASGDNLFPSNNQWAFRLSPAGTAYANYLFGSVLTKPFLDAIYTGANGATIPPLKVAVLYEEDSFGENAAVATATAAMGQNILVTSYGNFKAGNPDPTNLKNLITSVRDNGVQVVYLVASDTPVARNLVQTFQSVYGITAPLPILVGQAGGFASLEFLASPEAEGVYVMRQKLDRTSCPAEIKSIYDAQSYASVSLMDQAVLLARATLAAIPTQFSLASLTGQNGPTVLQQREAIRDALKGLNVNAPCLGPVAFDTTGANKLVQLELINIKNHQIVISAPTDFENTIKTTLLNGIPK